MKRKKQPEEAVEIERLICRWPYLPPHVRKTVLELAEHYGPPAIQERFPTPAGMDWSGIEITLLSPDTARIKAGDVEHTYTFQALGLADCRRPHVPRGEWRTLKTYAENPDPEAYRRLPYKQNLKVEISRFRAWLKRFFGLPGDPLTSFADGRWRPRFRICTTCL
jgi:hypothetical protein